MEEQKPLIEINNLVKRFGQFTALNGVSLKIYPGEVHALLGDNGAGKSTLIKVLSGVHHPSAGEIKIEGEKVNFLSPKDSSEAGIGTVYQDLALNPLTTVTRNFFLGREVIKGFRLFGLMDFKKRNFRMLMFSLIVVYAFTPKPPQNTPKRAEMGKGG